MPHCKSRSAGAAVPSAASASQPPVAQKAKAEAGTELPSPHLV